MYRIQRQIFWDVVVATAIATGFLVFLLLSASALRDIMELVAAGQVQTSVFFRLLGLLLPYVGAYALPIGLLAGILLVFGRMSAAREIVALRAAGMNYGTILAPVIVFVSLGVVFGLLVNVEYARSAKSQYRTLLGEIVRDQPTRFFAPKAFIRDFPGMVIYVGDREDDILEDFWVWQLDEEGRTDVAIRSEEGVLKYDRERGSIVVELQRAQLKRFARDFEDFGTTDRETLMVNSTSIELPLDRVLNSQERTSSLSRLTGRQLIQCLDAIERGRVTPIRLRDEVDASDIRTQFQENVAKSFAPLSLTLIAIPLAVRVGRKESHTNIAIALGMSLLYYFGLAFMGVLQEALPIPGEVLVWMPNLIFQFVGGLMMWRFLRG